MHEKRLVKEAEALGTIRYVSLILNELRPYRDATFPASYATCGVRESITLRNEETYIGYSRQLFCSTCQKAFGFRLTP